MFWVTITSCGVTPQFRHSITQTHINHETRQLNTKRTVTAYTYKLLKRTVRIVFSVGRQYTILLALNKTLMKYNLFLYGLEQNFECITYTMHLVIVWVPKRDGSNHRTKWPIYRGGSRGHPPKIGKNMIFWRKFVIFHTKYPKNVRASLRSAQFF
jgi:hypothetical protein